jgi:isopenicillin N synthase-like dioxygenase
MSEPHDGPNPTIPIIDFSAFTLEAALETRLKVARDLVSACREVGFVYISNHGVPADALAEAFALSKKFFDLPKEDKMKAPHPPGWAVHRGYSWPGLEKVSGAISEKDNKAWIERLREVQDYKESYEVGSEEFPDMPNVWPPADVLPEWKPFMSQFYWTCFEAAKNILRALALGMGMEDEDYLLRLHSGHSNQLRLLHYPPIPAAAIEGAKMSRMPAHCDWSTVTLLFQDDCGGLQIEDPKSPGRFIDAPPVPNTLIMNVGDLLMRWSNGKLVLKESFLTTV